MTRKIYGLTVWALEFNILQVFLQKLDRIMFNNNELWCCCGSFQSPTLLFQLISTNPQTCYDQTSYRFKSLMSLWYPLRAQFKTTVCDSTCAGLLSAGTFGMIQICACIAVQAPSTWPSCLKLGQWYNSRTRPSNPEPGTVRQWWCLV